MASGPTTRGIAQQQKLEEQLAVILQRLDQQKTDLDKRNEEQQRLAKECHSQLQEFVQGQISVLKEELHEQGHKLEAQKACYEELARVQRTQHQQLSEQMKEFADAQKQTIDDVSHRQTMTEEKLSTLDEEVKRLKQSHCEDVQRLEELKCNADIRLSNMESEIRSFGDDEVSSRALQELRTWQSQQLESLRQEMLLKLAKVSAPGIQEFPTSRSAYLSPARTGRLW